MDLSPRVRYLIHRTKFDSAAKEILISSNACSKQDRCVESRPRAAERLLLGSVGTHDYAPRGPDLTPRATERDETRLIRKELSNATHPGQFFNVAGPRCFPHHHSHWESGADRSMDRFQSCLPPGAEAARARRYHA